MHLYLSIAHYLLCFPYYHYHKHHDPRPHFHHSISVMILMIITISIIFIITMAMHIHIQLTGLSPQVETYAYTYKHAAVLTNKVVCPHIVSIYTKCVYTQSPQYRSITSSQSLSLYMIQCFMMLPSIKVTQAVINLWTLSTSSLRFSK